MTRRTFLGLALAGPLAACGNLMPADAVPAVPETLRVIVFPGGFNWPIWVAQQRGLFVRRGLDVVVTPTPNSTFQMSGLIRGDFDLAMTAMDNVIAYREGQGAPGVVGADLVAVMGSDNGFLRLVCAPDVSAIADLRGRTLSVDALTTGYAFVLLEILQRQGLALDRDYRIEQAGGVMQRYQALIERKHAATMLVAPFDVNAQEKGFKVLAYATEVLGDYQGVVGAVRQSWAAQHRRRIAAYIAAYAQAVDWLRDPANKEEALRIFLASMPASTTRQAAETAYRVLLDARSGFAARAGISLTGVDRVVQLRSKYGASGSSIKPSPAYLDESFHAAAMRAVR
jgi:ABC-type nitrate/sulfonate/bicarbonate transport system substrate-binding protein